MFDNLLGSTFGEYHFVALILMTVFIIPVFCMLASAIKNKHNFEVYATREVVVASLIVVSFILYSVSSLIALVTSNGSDTIIFTISIIGASIFLILFFVYIIILCQRKRAYGDYDPDMRDSAHFAFSIVELLAAIFQIFLG